MERPLPEKRALAVEHRDPVVAAADLPVGHVDVAGLLVDVEARGQEELRAVGVQRLTLARAVRGIVLPRLADLLQQLAASGGVLLHHAGPGRDDPQAAVRPDVAIVQPVADQRRVAPAPHDVARGIELNDRRRRVRTVEIGGDDVLPVEDEDAVPAADAHPAEAAGEPLLAERQLRPEGIELVAGDLLRRGRCRSNESGGDWERDAGRDERPYDGIPRSHVHVNLCPVEWLPGVRAQSDVRRRRCS